MKKSNRIFSFLLAALMCALLCVPAYAAGFDAGLTIQRGEGVITVTVQDSSVLHDKQPTLSIPAADTFKNALVLHDGAAADVTFADGHVSFTVAAGGTYNIAAGLSPAREEAPTCTEPGAYVYSFADTLYRKPIAAPGHDFSDTEKATCANCDEPNPDYTVPEAPVNPPIPPVTPPAPTVPSAPTEPEAPVAPDVPSVDTSAPTLSTETVEQEDGSTVTTETKANGVIVETVTNTDGSSVSTAAKTETVETESGSVTTTVSSTTFSEADGSTRSETTVETVETSIDEGGRESVTSTTETTLSDGTSAVTKVDSRGIVTAQVEIPAEVAESGRLVTLPVAKVSTTRDSAAAATITLITNSAEDTMVEIPVENVTAGTVVMVVDSEGKETVLKTSVVTDTGVAAALPDGATIKIVDNSLEFNDVTDDDWEKDAVDFTSSRGMFEGVGEQEFGPGQKMTRAMLMTVLARFDGHDTTSAEGQQWYAPGVDWAVENGIHSGENATGNIIREEITVMLWKYAGRSESSRSMDDFHDFDKAGSAEASAALRWAVENGVMNGVDVGVLDPTGEATRAHVAQFLKNFVENIR